LYAADDRGLKVYIQKALGVISSGGQKKEGAENVQKNDCNYADVFSGFKWLR
jgi:hypothetical protein